MKKLLLFGVFALSLNSFGQENSTSSLEKVIMIELEDTNQDSVLFKPYSKAWGELWQYVDPNLSVNGSWLMNYDKYKASFNNRNDNLWTSLHPMIIDGSLNLFYSYDPETMGLGPSDDGELRYPCVPMPGETIFTDENYRNALSYMLGRYSQPSDMPLIDDDPNSPNFGEPLIVTDTLTDLQMYVYPAPDFRWYVDKDVVKYKLRVVTVYNKKGKEKKRYIKSIAPVVYEFDAVGENKQEIELFWFDFNDLEKILKKLYFFNKEGKPKSYLKYIEERAL